MPKCPFGETPPGHLELQSADEGEEIGIPAPLTVPVDRPLDHNTSRNDGGK